MKHGFGRVARRGTGIGVAGALALTALVVPAAPASADSAIGANEEPFYSYYYLDAIRNSGITGKGKTIGLIDGPVNTGIPELTGADIEIYRPCQVNSQDKYWDHGTVIAQEIVSPQFGIAPGATLRAYGLSFAGDWTGPDCAIGEFLRGYSDLSVLIETALNDGVDVITTSASYPSTYEGMRWALARAIAQEVPVVACVGNDSTRDSKDWLPAWGGVVGVAAIEHNGVIADYSNWGSPVSTAALARPYVRSGVSQERGNWWGTSFATPLVAGSLALSMERWPGASGNQIMQGLAHTGVGGNGGQWNPYTGYGALDVYALLTTSPMSFPDENPFMDKGENTVPSRQDVQDYKDGVVDPRVILNDNSYQYRGLDERLVVSRDNTYPTHLGTSPRYHQKPTQQTTQKKTRKKK